MTFFVLNFIFGLKTRINFIGLINSISDWSVSVPVAVGTTGRCTRVAVWSANALSNIVEKDQIELCLIFPLV